MLAGYLGDPDAIRSARADPDPVVRARAVSAADRLGRRTVAERVRDLRDAALEVRQRACELEARRTRPSVRVEAALIACLSDPEPLVVVPAAEALGELGSHAATGPLAATARAHDDARCREAAIAAIGAAGDVEGLDAVLGALDDKPAVRRRAVVALAAFSGERVEAALAAALEDRDWQVREVARALLAVEVGPDDAHDDEVIADEVADDA